jgi:DNA repair exonuclease SbcCD nuclease subunit
MAQMGLEVDFIVGNHDCYFKNTNRPNALNELVSGRYPDFRVHGLYPAEMIFGNITALLIPWICDENHEMVKEYIRKSTSKILFGHLELQGFEMYKGVVATTGEDASGYKKFSKVFSGHYHHRSSRGNIHYLGSPFEYTWADYNDSRGFHTFDTDTLRLEFIENPYKMFRKVVYDDTNEDFTLPKEVEGSMVRVVVENKTNAYLFDRFIESVEASNPLNLQIDDKTVPRMVTELSELIDTKSSIEKMFAYIDVLDGEVNKEKLKTLFLEVYNAAHEVM